MARQNKRKSLQIKEKEEVNMTEEAVLDTLQTEIDLARVELEKTKLELEERKKELENKSNREISYEEVKIIDKQISHTNEKKASDDIIEKQKAYDNVMVTGKFINRRYPGQPIKLPYLKYADDPVKWYPFEDGKVYTIPRGFADQINGGSENDPCYYMPQFRQKEEAIDPNAPSSQIHSVDTSNKKYAFVPVNFS